jgi:hypothetical protein
LPALYQKSQATNNKQGDIGDEGIPKVATFFLSSGPANKEKPVGQLKQFESRQIS